VREARVYYVLVIRKNDLQWVLDIKNKIKEGMERQIRTNGAAQKHIRKTYINFIIFN